MRVAAHNLEHIVLGGINRAAVYLGRTFREDLHHFFLVFRGLGHNVVVFHLRGGQIQLIGGLDVRHLFEQVHQLREVEELAESRSCPIAGALRGQLQRRCRFTKARRPAVKMGHAQLLQPVILEIPLHGVKLGHGIADRGAGGENHTTVSGDLVHIATLGKHIRGFLRVRCG